MYENAHPQFHSNIFVANGQINLINCSQPHCRCARQKEAGFDNHLEYDINIYYAGPHHFSARMGENSHSRSRHL